MFKIKKSCLFAAAALLAHTFNASASDAGPAPVTAARVSSDSAFNPAISLILSGTFATLQQDPTIPATGFAMNSNPGHEQGFNLGETELGISANIDASTRGAVTLALDPIGAIGVENAFVQNSALGHGFNLKFGRFFSGLGYLNEQHAHARDFVDQPLIYAALWANQLAEDGVQLKWLAPADMFIEIGAEAGKGLGFPGTATPRNGSNAGALFVHIGDDLGIEHNWRAGASLHKTHRVDAESVDVPDQLGNAVTNLFTGDSQTTGLDFVWKFAPGGNATNNYVKLQGEYFRREETGDLTYDTGSVVSGPTTATYSVTQSGWYVQGVVQFIPQWRTGLRYDQLDSGIATVGAANAANVIGDYGYTPRRATFMVDYSPSEFSRVRLQFAHDKSRQGLEDRQVFVQYLMSLGAHGAHSY